MKTSNSVFIRLLFIIYCAVMIWLLFIQRIGRVADYGVNIIPLRTVHEYIGMYRSGHPNLVNHAIVNIGGNIIMFIPFGFLIPCLSKIISSITNVIIITIVTIFAVEIVQYALRLGAFDIDDLILNTLGSAFGYIILRITKNAFT